MSSTRSLLLKLPTRSLLPFRCLRGTGSNSSGYGALQFPSQAQLLARPKVRFNSSSAALEHQSEIPDHAKASPIGFKPVRSMSTLESGAYKSSNDEGRLEPPRGEIKIQNNVVQVGDKRVPNVWLRDNCQCASCVHTDTKQRLLDTFTIPRDISIQSSKVQAKGLVIEWSDGHKSSYKNDFILRAYSYPEQKSIVRQGSAKLTKWDASIASDPPRLQYQEPGSNPDFDKELMRRLRQYGFCYIDSTPFDDPNTTKALLESIAFIRPTHYGGFYDFTADLASADTAYTNIALEAHTDNTYFSDPAGLQAFHLLSHTDGDGGASLLVDGFKVAQDLHAQDPRAYETLAQVNVNCHASGNDGISIQPYKGFPVLQHDPTTRHLLQVRWNSSDRASIELPLHRVEEWYDAARKWDALVKKSENEYWEQLTPGRVLVFDNWRVMHGRSAFTGKRRICGAYINRDDWISKYKMLHHGRETVLDHLATG